MNPNYRYHRLESVVAHQVNENTFLKDHPNDEHFKGVIYNSLCTTATIPSGKIANISDWIVQDEKTGSLNIVSDYFFQKHFRQVWDKTNF